MMSAVSSHKSKSASLSDSQDASADCSIVGIGHVSEILVGRLFLSSMYFGPDTLRTLSISHVLCVAEGAAFRDHPADGLTDVHLARFEGMFLDDWGGSDLALVLPRHISYIRRALASSRGCCLVHCQLGINRSVVVVVAYLMAEHNFSFDESKRHVAACRPAIFMHDSYEAQLRAVPPDWAVRSHRCAQCQKQCVIS